MATAAQPPIVGTAVAAWRDAFAAVSAMPVLSGIVFILLAALSAFSILVLPAPTPEAPGVGMQIVGVITAIIQAFLIAPLAIAVHRYVLLGERTAGYSVDPSSPRYMRFVGFAVLLNLLLLVPSLMLAVAPPDHDNGAMAAIAGILAFVLFVVVAIVSLRRAILFPAIAVDAPGANWRNARNDTKGRSWRVLFILICTTIPVLAVSFPLYWLLMRPPGVTLGGRLVFAVLSTLVQVPAICAFAAVASHLFRALADSLARPQSAA